MSFFHHPTSFPFLLYFPSYRKRKQQYLIFILYILFIYFLFLCNFFDLINTQSNRVDFGMRFGIYCCIVLLVCCFAFAAAKSGDNNSNEVQNLIQLRNLASRILSKQIRNPAQVFVEQATKLGLDASSSAKFFASLRNGNPDSDHSEESEGHESASSKNDNADQGEDIPLGCHPNSKTGLQKQIHAQLMEMRGMADDLDKAFRESSKSADEWLQKAQSVLDGKKVAMDEAKKSIGSDEKDDDESD
jgi:hypothetical protein